LIKDKQLFQFDYETYQFKTIKTEVDISTVKNIFYDQGSFYYFDGLEKQKMPLLF
jgi:hypothetical protein